MSKKNLPKAKKLNGFANDLAYERGYTQALNDYAITALLDLIQLTNPTLSLSEAQMIAALLIEQLRQLITPEMVSNYANLIFHPDPVDPFLKYPQYQHLLRAILLKSKI